jgi:5-methylcytosine-specific restriction endonuclease McrA
MNKEQENFKLTIELVPQTSWFKSMREIVSRSVWDKIRNQAYASSNQACVICGYTEGRLNCHEIWEYDDQKHIQKLIGFIALCDMCHHVKHIGKARVLADEGKLNYE